jgi:hypothetical protein
VGGGIQPLYAAEVGIFHQGAAAGTGNEINASLKQAGGRGLAAAVEEAGPIEQRQLQIRSGQIATRQVGA